MIVSDSKCECSHISQEGVQNFGLASFYNNCQFSDVIIYSCDGASFHAHKLCIARWSAPLLAMLLGDSMREGREHAVTLPNANAVILAAFLKFLYNVHENYLELEDIIKLYALGDQWAIPALREACKRACIEGTYHDAHQPRKTST